MKQTTPKTARKPRVFDPGILEIKERHRAEIKSYASDKAGDRILQTIIDKRLARMTTVQKHRLADELSKTITPRLEGL